MADQAKQGWGKHVCIPSALSQRAFDRRVLEKITQKIIPPGGGQLLRKFLRENLRRPLNRIGSGFVAINCREDGATEMRPPAEMARLYLLFLHLQVRAW